MVPPGVPCLMKMGEKTVTITVVVAVGIVVLVAVIVKNGGGNRAMQRPRHAQRILKKFKRYVLCSLSFVVPQANQNAKDQKSIAA